MPTQRCIQRSLTDIFTNGYLDETTLSLLGSNVAWKGRDNEYFMLASSAFVAWFASIQDLGVSISEPLGIAAWGCGLLIAGMIVRNLGDRPQDRP